MTGHVPSSAARAAELALARFLLENVEPLIEAAGHLGGRPAVRRTARLFETMIGECRMTPHLRREILNLHRLLCLHDVQDLESLEAACFAMLDPDSALVTELCRLADGLGAHLDALAAALPPHPERVGRRAA